MSVTRSELEAALIAHEALAEPGPKGDPGRDGTDGRDGKDGRDGVDGKDGRDGADGRSIQGAKGDPGERGPRGPQGDPGRDGVSITGPAGPAGKDGIDGLDGKDGERGPRGLPGEKGEKGDRGEPGKPGEAGSGGGGYAGVQIMSDGEVVSSYALSLDLGTGLDVAMDRNVARVSVSPTAGSDANYVHSQLSAAAEWDITHNLGKKPSVSVVDSGGTTVIGDVDYLDDNHVRLRFGVPFGGAAYLN